MNDELLTTRQAAEVAGVSMTTIKNWRLNGRLEVAEAEDSGRRQRHLPVFWFTREAVLAAAAVPPPTAEQLSEWGRRGGRPPGRGTSTRASR